MFVTKTDFNNPPYSIPAVDLDGNSFQPFVNKKEEDVLRTLLGHKLYDQFIEGLADDYPETNFPEMAALRDGAYYDGDVQNKWVGVVELLKPFIYSQWLYTHIEQYTKSGVVVSKVENATVIDPRGEISRANADFLMLAGWKRKSKDSLYGFLKANISGYEDWAWTDPGSLNRWDL